MNLELLEQIGLTKNESTIYIDLISRGQSTANEVAEHTGLHRAYVYDTLTKLVHKGIVSYITKSGKKYFKGAHPKKFLSILKEQESMLGTLIPQLTRLYKEDREDYDLEILDGKEGVKTFFDHMLYYFMNHKKEEILIIGAKIVLVEDQLLKYFMHSLTGKARKKGFIEDIRKGRIKARALLDHTAKGEKREVKGYVNYRYLPKSFDSGKVTIRMVGEKIGIEAITEKPYVMLITSRRMSDFFRQIFDVLWHVAEE